MCFGFCSFLLCSSSVRSVVIWNVTKLPPKRSAIDAVSRPWIMYSRMVQIWIFIACYIPHAQWAHYSEIKYCVFFTPRLRCLSLWIQIKYFPRVIYPTRRVRITLVKSAFGYIVRIMGWWNFYICPWYAFSYHPFILNTLFLHSWWTYISPVWRREVAAGCSWRLEDPSGHGGLARSKDLSRML